jgi:hypothetical protein
MIQRRETTRRRWHLLGWSSPIAGALLLGLLLDAGVTNGTGEVVQAVPPRILESPATAALLDGDDVRARFLANAH